MAARNIGTILLLAAWALAFPALPAQAESDPDGQNAVLLTLNSDSGVRMSPLHAAEAAGGGLHQAGYLESSPSYDLSLPSREYSFTEFLLNKNGDPQAEDCAPSTAMALAIALRDTKLLGRLLDKGIDPDAALTQPVPVWLPGLFENGFIARVLAKDSRVTPLMLAVLSGQPQIVRMLLQHGANTEICTKALHMYPLDFAAELKDLGTMQLLLGHEQTGDGEGRHVIISLYAQKAWLMTGSAVLYETPVSTGRPGFETHLGEFVVTQKYTAWKSTLYKAPMPNFLRLNCGPAGMHSGVVPGVPASHGCIRLPPRNAGIFYNVVKLGDRVSIVE